MEILGYENGMLCIVTMTPRAIEPLIDCAWWPVKRASRENLARELGDGWEGAPLYSMGNDFYVTQSPLKNAVFFLNRAAGPIKQETVAAKRPKTRRIVRWRNGRWEARYTVHQWRPFPIYPLTDAIGSLPRKLVPAGLDEEIDVEEDDVPSAD